METLLSDLIPLIVGAALLPAWIILVLILLTGERGLGRAAAFVAGATVTRLVQGILFGFVFTGDPSAETGPGPVALTLLTVVGLLLLITAYKKWSKEEDPDVPPPAWMARLTTLSPAQCFLAGALLTLIAVKLWAFTLSVIALLGYAELTTTAAVLYFLLYVLLAQSLMIVPILMQALAPGAAARTLPALRGWLERHNRVITVSVSLLFGILFLWKGVSGLLG